MAFGALPLKNGKESSGDEIGGVSARMHRIYQR